MEAIEAIAKLLALLFMYAFLFLLGGTLLCFMLLVGGAYAISSYFGAKKSGKLELIDLEVRSETIYVHDTLILYKKEEYAAQVMYEMKDSVIDILSITNAQEDFTDLLPPEEIARITVEIEFSHVD